MKHIKWVDATNSKPAIDTESAYKKAKAYSKRVLIWMKHADGTEQFRFGFYIHNESYPQWSCEGITGGSYIVTHYAPINSPL